MGRVIKAKPVTKEPKGDNTLQLLARLCYHYPQYTFVEARKLPARRVRLLLAEAQIIEAERMAQLVQIVAAPHTKDGKGVKKLFNHFKQVSNG